MKTQRELKASFLAQFGPRPSKKSYCTLMDEAKAAHNKYLDKQELLDAAKLWDNRINAFTLGANAEKLNR